MPEAKPNMRENIRKRPGMYIGFLNHRGAEHAILEFVSNAIDQFLAGKCSEVHVLVEGDRITIEDDGPGYPLSSAGPEGRRSLGEWFLTSPHFNATADGHAPHVHLVSLGLGIAVINALSAELTVRSRSEDGFCWEQKYEFGLPLTEPVKVEPIFTRGTRFSFRLDPGLFITTLPRLGEIRRRLFHAAHLFPGLKFSLNEERFHAPEGLAGLARLLCDDSRSWSDAEPFSFNGRYGDLTISAACHGERARNVPDRPVICSWANGALTRRHGEHVNGFKDALRLARRRPAVILINVVLWDPRFAGPTKDELCSPTVRQNVRDALREPIREWK